MVTCRGMVVVLRREDGKVVRREDDKVVRREDGHVLMDGGCIEEGGWSHVEGGWWLY